MRLLINLGSLFLIVAGLFVRSAFMLFVVVVLLIIVGKLYPYAAFALGLPDPTLYGFVSRLVSGLFEVIRYLLGR